MSNETASGNGHDDEVSRSAHKARAESTLSSNDAPSVATHESGDALSAFDESTDSDALARGSTVGRYLVLERIGAGAMGVVYAAYDPELDRKIALKLLRPQQTEGNQTRRRARMVREAKAVAKVSHPNVVGIFDVGVHEGQVFMAMEHLSGGTLREWVATKKLAWREIVRMYIEVGHGLAAAHAEGLIHRDFKPDNVLLDKNGVPKVVDFGLVRIAAVGDGLTESGATDRETATASPDFEPALRKLSGGPAALTRTGALTGTPAYMAPEQFYSRPVDARTDQFAFCVSLYEALYRERPFAGSNVIQLADSVTMGRVREAAKDAEVPAWLRRAVVRGLATNAEARWPSIETLVAVLADDPAVRRRRRLLVGSAVSLAVIGVAVARQMVVERRHEVDRQVTQHLDAATAALAEATQTRTEGKVLRDRAMAAFDGFKVSDGEELWTRSRGLTKAAAAAYQKGIRHLEAATTLAPDNLRDRTADTITDYLALDGVGASDRDAAMRELSVYDAKGARATRLNARAHVFIDTSPPGLAARLEKYDEPLLTVIEPARVMGQTPVTVDLAPGSYRFIFEGTSTHVPFNLPVRVTAGETFNTRVSVPRRSAVPTGFIFIPEGRSLFGSGDEEMREFCETVPIHPVSTPAFLIARHETTIADWIGFLETLPSAERELRRPQGKKDALEGFIDVRYAAASGWTIAFRATDRTYRAKAGEVFRYQDRQVRASQDWMKFPVSGVSPEDALAYTLWLDQSGRVPGARLCNEREWERAARGADEREFPHGRHLAPADANFDLTYGRQNGAYGPDEVGSHPASASPFGADDMVGNVWDITSSVLDRGQFVARGGSFYQYRKSQMSTNRDPLSAVTRDHTLGLRVCADVVRQ